MRILYHTPILPACRKIRVLMKEKELAYETFIENPWEGRQEFMDMNPAGEMPLLVEDNGMIVAGGYAIAEYLEETYPEKPLLGGSIAERAEIRRLIDWFDARFYQEACYPIIHEKMIKKITRSGEPDSRAIRLGSRNILYHMDYIANLVKERHWLACERFTLADIAAAAHFSVLDYLGDVPWDYNPSAKHWYALVKSRPSFRPVLNDRIAAFRPPAHYDNPDF